MSFYRPSRCRTGMIDVDFASILISMIEKFRKINPHTFNEVDLSLVTKTKFKP